MSQIKRGAILSYFNIFLTNIIGLVLTPFIIRSLGDSEYGLYSLIGAFVGYIAVMDLGLNNTIVRYVAKYRAAGDKVAEEKFLGTSLIIYSVISVVVVVIGVFFYYNIESIFGSSLKEHELDKAKIMTLILIFNLAITLPGGAFTAISNAYEKFVFPRALSNIKYIVRSVLVVLILYLGADSIGLVILDTAVNVFTIIATFLYVKKNIKVKFRFKRPERAMLYEIFSYSIWIFIFAIIGQMQWKGGQFVIGTALGTEDVAVYVVGILLGSYYGAFSAAVSSLFLPRATQMVVKGASEQELTNTFIKVARYSLFSLLLIFIGFVGLGKDFIILWVGIKYIKAYYIAIIIMIGYTTPLIQTFANSLLEAKKLFVFKTIVYFFAIAMGTIICFFVVKHVGIVGVSITIVASWLICQFVMNIYFYKVLKLNIVTFFAKLFKDFGLAIIIFAFVTYLIVQLALDGWIGFSVKALLIVLCYCMLLYFVVLTNAEKNMFLKFKRK